MSKTSAKNKPKAAQHRGAGNELHQQVNGEHVPLATNQGVPIAENQNSLRGHPSGPTLLEDFILREKITHFDHERIPERTHPARHLLGLHLADARVESHGHVDDVRPGHSALAAHD